MTLLAPVGVGVMIAVSWALGGLRTSRLRDPQDAESLLHADFPDFAPTETIVGLHGKAALCSGDTGVGIVTAWGDKFVTTILRRGDVAAVDCRSLGNMDYLEIRTADFSRPRIRIALKAQDAALWRKRLEGLPA